MSKEEEAPKYQLEDILNKKKPPPSILDLHNIKCVLFVLFIYINQLIIWFDLWRIDTEEEFKKAVEKIPDYKIKAEKVSDIWLNCKVELKL